MGHAGVDLVKCAALWATTGQGNRRWNGGQLEVAQEAGQHRLLGDGGNDAQGAAAATWTGCHSQSKHATQQSGPVPIRGSRLRFLAVATLLVRCGHDRRPERARRRQAAGRADKVRTRQGHKRRTLLQKLQRREFHAGGAVRPGPVAAVYAIPVRILLKPLKRYGPSVCLAHQALQLIRPLRWNHRVGRPGKAVDTGTTGACACRPFACRAKARADAAHLLFSPCATGDTRLDRSRHGAGKLWCGVAKQIIPSGHGHIHAGFQVAQPAERADDPPTDVLDHLCHIRIAGRLTLEKTGV